MISFLIVYSIQSRFGTFVNDHRRNGIELVNGDIISLVDSNKVPLNQRDKISAFTFILRRIEPDSNLSRNNNDDRQLDNALPDMGEILISTQTETIVISDDDDDNDHFDVYASNQISAEDYEVGESSSTMEPKQEPKPRASEPKQETKPEPKPEQEPEREPEPVLKPPKLIYPIAKVNLMRKY